MNALDCLASMQYIDSAILNLSIDNDYILFDVTDETRLNVDIDYKINEIEKTDIGFIGTITLLINWTASTPENNVSFNVASQGAFLFPVPDESEINNDITEEIEKKLSLNGVSTMYSICRGKMTSIFSQICSGKNLELPMINVLDLYEKKQSELTSKKAEE